MRFRETSLKEQKVQMSYVEHERNGNSDILIGSDEMLPLVHPSSRSQEHDSGFSSWPSWRRSGDPARCDLPRTQNTSSSFCISRATFLLLKPVSLLQRGCCKIVNHRSGCIT
ncbi:uncharacterized protein LOC122567040 [Bombus pyrosoma]|uniref:uncharacterized protein LOC122567040 n=1 Tax=Bombus pyrosoma TaxID=396416 RepID=UPI001CB96146|nr:uncharacterized protein LOC122567040 [Bombus pyrosoma]